VTSPLWLWRLAVALGAVAAGAVALAALSAARTPNHIDHQRSRATINPADDKHPTHISVRSCSVTTGRPVNSDQQQVEVGVHRGPWGRRWVLSSAVFDLSASCPPHDHSPTPAVERLI